MLNLSVTPAVGKPHHVRNVAHSYCCYQTMRWLKPLLHLRIWAILGVLGAALTFLAGLITHGQTVVDFVSAWFSKPSVLAFTLGPKARGFTEDQENLFGASNELYRTFSPKYPFTEPPIASFLVTFRNPTGHDLILTKVVYDVARIGQVKGGPAGPLVALATYKHVLRHVTGEQPNQLVPPFRIPANDEASLELQLTTDTAEAGLGWLLKIGFVSDRITFYTDQFQLYLPQPSESTDLPAQKTPQADSRPTQTPTRDLLHQSVQLKLPTVQERDCIFSKTGVLPFVQDLDQLDRDMIFLQAGGDTIEEFGRQKTQSSTPVPYSKLFPAPVITDLLTAVKSRVACDR